MAKFGIEATNISDPSLSAASFVRPATEDKSGIIRMNAEMGLANTIASQALPVYTSMQKREINQQTQDVIQDYMNRRANPELAKETLGAMGAQDVATSLFRPQGEQLSGVEKAQRERLATYQQALEQGVMSQEEFSDRVLANLREMTNRNPGLYEELKAEASRVMELSGITGIMKSDKLIAESKAKQEEKITDDLNKRLEREHIYYDHTTPLHVKLDLLQAAENDTRKYNLQVRGKERFAMATQEQARQWQSESGDAVLRGSISTAQKLIMEIADRQGITAETYAKHKAEVETTLDAMFNTYVQSIPVNIRQEPGPQADIKMYSDNIKLLKDRFNGMVSGEDFKKVLTNQVEIIKASQDKRLRETIDVASMDMAIKLAAANTGIITQSPEYRKNLFNAGVAISSGNFSSPALSQMVPKSDKDTASASLISGAVNLGKQSGDYAAFGQTLAALNSQVEGITNTKTRLQYQYNNVLALSKAIDIKPDAAGIQQVEETVDKFLTDPQYGVGTLVDTAKGKNMSMDRTPEGKFMFVGPDAAPFNKAYANNINISIEAYANAHGISVKEASDIVIPKYLGGIVKAMRGPTPASTPVDTTSAVAPTTEVAPEAAAAPAPAAAPSAEEKEALASQSALDKQLAAPVVRERPPKPDLYKQQREELVNYTNRVASKYGEALSAVDEAIFGSWRELVVDGLMAEKDYRDRVQKKLGIKK